MYLRFTWISLVAAVSIGGTTLDDLERVCEPLASTLRASRESSDCLAGFEELISSPPVRDEMMVLFPAVVERVAVSPNHKATRRPQGGESFTGRLMVRVIRHRVAAQK